MAHPKQSRKTVFVYSPPNEFQPAHNAIGLATWFTGRAEATESHCLEALRLSPRDTSARQWTVTAGGAKLYLGRDEEAVAWFR
jgi:hypothetical protein